MPKDTFYNLDKEKKDKILKAAEKEFAENQLYKCRVSNIIKDAQIPRGSFYQYFEDLDDLYYYVVDQVFDKIFEEGKKYSDQTSDLFEYIKLTFLIDIDNYLDRKTHKFMRNVLQSIGSNEKYLEHQNKKREAYILEILDKMDLSMIKLHSNDDLIKMYGLLQQVKRNVIRDSLIQRWSKEKAMKELEWNLKILQTGLLKEEIDE